MFETTSADPSVEALPPDWCPIAYFDDRGRCVAGLEIAALRILSDGAPVNVCGARRVGVLPSWRGLGLFRSLMEHAIAWSRTHRMALMLLYAEEPELYVRFGFETLAQHAFAGSAPQAARLQPLEILDLGRDRQRIVHLLANRAPVSNQVAMIDAQGLFLERLATDVGPGLAYLPGAEALVVYEIEDDALTLVDCAAPLMPSAAQIVGAFPESVRRVRTLFPPDLLNWEGRAVLDDTGLMARGTLPPSMKRPFMLPPTAEF